MVCSFYIFAPVAFFFHLAWLFGYPCRLFLRIWSQQWWGKKSEKEKHSPNAEKKESRLNIKPFDVRKYSPDVMRKQSASPPSQRLRQLLLSVTFYRIGRGRSQSTFAYPHSSNAATCWCRFFNDRKRMGRLWGIFSSQCIFFCVSNAKCFFPFLLLFFSFFFCALHSSPSC